MVLALPLQGSILGAVVYAVLGVGFWVGGFVVAYLVYRRYRDKM